MPSVFRHRGFNFFFYSNEGTPREPAHVHVEKDGMEAKFWLKQKFVWPTMMGMTPGLFASYWKQ